MATAHPRVNVTLRHLSDCRCAIPCSLERSAARALRRCGRGWARGNGGVDFESDPLGERVRPPFRASVFEQDV
jgi:hypothetical protein